MAHSQRHELPAPYGPILAGADGVEIDIRRSKDGVIYLHHDDTAGRMIPGDGKILNTDFGVLNSKIPSVPVAKPAGH